MGNPLLSPRWYDSPMLWLGWQAGVVLVVAWLLEGVLGDGLPAGWSSSRSSA